MLVVTLGSLEKKLPRVPRRAARTLTARVKGLGPDPSGGQLRRTYVELAALIEEITSLQEDLEWQQR